MPSSTLGRRVLGASLLAAAVLMVMRYVPLKQHLAAAGLPATLAAALLFIGVALLALAGVHLWRQPRASDGPAQHG